MRRSILFSVKLLGAGTAFALLFHFVDPGKVLAALKGANPAIVALGVLLFLGGQVVAAARWQRILSSGDIHISLKSVWRMNLIGTFVGNFLPSTGTGDLAKSVLLFRDFPEKRSFLVASVVYDRLLGLAATMLMAIVGALLFGMIRNDWWFIRYTFIAAVILAAGMAILAFGPFFARIWFFLPRAFAMRVSVFAIELQRLVRNYLLLLRTLGPSLAFQASWVVSQWLMLIAISPGAPLVPVVAASPLSLIVALLPISLNGLGLREGTFSYILQRFGIDSQVAIAASLLSLLPILASSLIGGLLLIRSNRLCRSAASEKVEKGTAL